MSKSLYFIKVTEGSHQDKGGYLINHLNFSDRVNRKRIDFSDIKSFKYYGIRAIADYLGCDFNAQVDRNYTYLVFDGYDSSYKAWQKIKDGLR